MRISCFVYETKNYNNFKYLKGNRDILNKRKETIIQSIQENGWITNPIVVNENMEIIDGQGRFEALKELGMPVQYVIAEGATIETCITLNFRQKNWTSDDYIKCFADLGNTNYVILKKCMETYGLGCDATAVLLSSNFSDTQKNKTIQRGEFKVDHQETAFDLMHYSKAVYEIIGERTGRKRTWAPVIKMVFLSPEIDSKVFLDKLEKFKVFIEPCVNIHQAIACFEKIYNYHSHGHKVFFEPIYDRIK